MGAPHRRRTAIPAPNVNLATQQRRVPSGNSRSAAVGRGAQGGVGLEGGAGRRGAQGGVGPEGGAGRRAVGRGAGGL